MKTFLDCIPCVVKQVLKAGRIATDNEELIKRMLDRIGEEIKNIPLNNTPPEIGKFIYSLVSEMTNNPDPYKEIKDKNISEAQNYYDRYRKLVLSETNRAKRIALATRIAVAGNVIDLGVDREFNLEKDIENAVNQDFKVWDFDILYQLLETKKKIMYIGDNSGEAVFDKILLEQLPGDITFVTRGKPVINDVTLLEAKQIGIEKYANLLDSGSPCPGAVLSECSEDFKTKFSVADIIIAKGQGNYEALSKVDRDVFFLLKAKCPIIARDAGVVVEDNLLMYKQK